jgi:hypothetical protein
MSTKICSTCKIERPLTDYYRIQNGTDGTRPRCKACHQAFERKKYAENAEWRIAKLEKHQAKLDADPEFKKLHRFRVRRWHLKATYGLSLDDYEALLQRQNGVCAICGRDNIKGNQKRDLVVDHCHATGKVRGLLCDLCNTAIGKMQDSSAILRKAAAYIDSHA